MVMEPFVVPLNWMALIRSTFLFYFTLILLLVGSLKILTRKKNSLVAPSHNYPCAKAVLRTKNKKKTKFFFWRQNEEAENYKKIDEKPNHILTPTYKLKRITTTTPKKRTTNNSFYSSRFGFVSFHIILCTLIHTRLFIFLLFKWWMGSVR